MINAKPITWMFVTATAAVIAIGSFVPELGLALASVALGGSALVASLFARKSASGDSKKLMPVKKIVLEETA